MLDSVTANRNRPVTGVTGYSRLGYREGAYTVPVTSPPCKGGGGYVRDGYAPGPWPARIRLRYWLRLHQQRKDKKKCRRRTRLANNAG